MPAIKQQHLVSFKLRYMDDAGFVLIALVDGFVNVTALDLGAPPWIVTPAAILAVAVGHYCLARAKQSTDLARGTDGANKP